MNKIEFIARMSELAEEMADYLESTYEDVEVEIHEGKQPVYPYLMSVE